MTCPDCVYAEGMRKALEQCATYAGPAGNIAIAALAKNPNPSGQLTAEASVQTPEASGSVGLGPLARKEAGIETRVIGTKPDAHLTEREPVSAIDWAWWRLRNYVRMRKEKPLSGLTDIVHSIHMGTPWAAEILLSDIATVCEAHDAPRTVQEQEKP